MNSTRDAYLGLFYGCALGDSLGHPYEFVYGRIPYKYELTSNGSVSDDTEMMMALFTSIVTEDGWKRDKVIQAYTRWVGSGVFDLGVNTRNLFCDGICFPDKMVQLYEANMKSEKTRPIHLWTQSNGCLMRCMPLIFCTHETQQEDCALTNPHPTCLEASRLYFCMIEQCIQRTFTPILELASTIKSNDLREAISDAISLADLTQPGKRKVHQKRGWITHAIYFAVAMYHHSIQTFEEGMQFVIGCHLDSDTDTNAAIAGAILGCKLGFSNMIQEEKTAHMIDLINQPTSRPSIYQPRNITSYVDQLYK